MNLLGCDEKAHIEHLEKDVISVFSRRHTESGAQIGENWASVGVANTRLAWRAQVT